MFDSRLLRFVRRFGIRMGFHIWMFERWALSRGWPQDRIDEYIATAFIGG